MPHSQSKLRTSLHLLQDPDALEPIEDLRIWQNEPNEIYEMVETIVSMR